MYPKVSNICSIIYGLPEKPPSIDDDYFVQMSFGEGFRLRYLFSLLELWVYLRKNHHKIDLVHYYSSLLILFGPVIAWLAGVPSVVTVTGLGRIFSSKAQAYQVFQPIYFILFRMSTRFARRVLFQNRGDLAILAIRFPNTALKFAFVGSGVSMPIVDEKSFIVPCLNVLLVVRIMPEKGVEDFLAVAEKFFSRGIFNFVLVGPGSTGHENLLELVRKYHEKGIITYKGELSPDSTLEQFAQSQIFFFPSFYGEGIARVMLECGYSKMCPIAYDLVFNRDLVDAGRGFLVKVGDLNSVVDILNHLREDRNLLESNARAYQEYVTRHYSMEVFSNRMDQILIGLAQEIGLWPTTPTPIMPNT